MRYGNQDELISQADIDELFPDPLCPPQFERIVAPRPLPKRAWDWRIFAVIGAALVVLALAVALVVVRPFSSVRASYYAQAGQKTVSMSEAFAKTSAAFTSAYSFIYSTPIDSTAVDTSEFTAAVKEFDQQVDEFADERAMRDEEVKASYDSYQLQAKQYVKLMNALAESASGLAQAASVCVQTPTVGEGDSDYYDLYEQYVADCRSNLEPLAQSQASVIQTYANNGVATLNQMTDVINQMKAIGSFSAATTAQYQQLSSLADQLVDLDAGYGALSTFQSDLQQAEEASNPTQTLQELNTLLTTKYQEKSK